MIESVRAGWTEDERDELAEWALQRLVPQWRHEETVDQLKAAVDRMVAQRQSFWDHRTRMKALWDEQVSPNRGTGTTRMRRMVATEDVESEVGEPESDELREWLETPEGRVYAEQETGRIERKVRFHAGALRRERELVAAVRTRFEAEWTADLLAGRFVMPGGAVASWGSATFDQHRVRAELLARQAGASAETMKRHEAAMELLMQTGAGCLTEAISGGQ